MLCLCLTSNGITPHSHQDFMQDQPFLRMLALVALRVSAKMYDRRLLAIESLTEVDFQVYLAPLVKNFLIILDAWQTHARTYSRTILGSDCNLWRVRSTAFGRPTNSAQVKRCNLIRDFPKFQLNWHVFWMWPLLCYGQTDIHSNNREIGPPPSLRPLSRNIFLILHIGFLIYIVYSFSRINFLLINSNNPIKWSHF